MRAVAILVVVASVCVVGGCSGDPLAVNINGTWAFLVEFNECPMFGFMRGGPSNALAIDITQSGDQLSASFQDPQGIDWQMEGSISGYHTYMYWTGRSSEDRVIEIMSEGWIQGGGANLVMDGLCVVHYDSWGLCYNEQYNFWGDGSGIVPQTNPPPDVIIKQCPGVEICFLMDTSGSMNDEAAELCAAILQVESDLLALGLKDIKIAILGITSTKSGNPDFSCLTDHVQNLFGDFIPGNPSVGNEILDDSEDWGPATAVVAANKNWTPGYIRILVPISDEGPEDGDSCSNQSDTDSITNAIAVAVANNVIVSPIAAGSPGSPPDSCVLNHATDLANGTNGKVSVSQDPSGTFSQLIFDLIVDACSTTPPPPPPPPVVLATLAYVGHGYTDGVHVINTVTMTEVGNIEGAGGYRLALSLDGNTLFSTGGDSNAYVSDAIGYNLITAFNPADAVVRLAGQETIISVELEPIVLSPDGSRVYILDEQGNNAALFVLDAVTNRVIARTILSMDEPENVVISPDGLFLYCEDNSNAVKISTTTLTIVGTATSYSDAHGIAINPAGTRIYFDGAPGQGVPGGFDVVDTSDMSLVVNIPGPTGSGYHMEMSHDGRYVYAVDESDKLSVIDTTTNTLQTVTLSVRSARGVTTNADGSVILIATSSGLIKMNAATLLETGFLAGSFQSVVFARTPVAR